MTECVAEVSAMDRSQLLSSWARLFGSPPGSYISVKLMRSMLAYEAQIEVQGGLPSHAARELTRRAEKLHSTCGDDEQIAAGTPVSKNGDPPPPPPLLRPGVQLMREWNGRTYRVEVAEDGFRLDGKSYKSLTAIARRITGSHWSGPRFFGLTSQ